MKWVQNNTPLIFAVVFIALYAIWMIWFRLPDTPENGFITTKPAVSTPKVDGPIIKPPVKIVPKKKVESKFPAAQIADDEEWVDTADIPPAPNGATILTKIDTITGDVTNQVQNKKAPWFAFEDNNYVGVGFEQHVGGNQFGKIYYKRDLVRIKDVHVQAEVQGKAGTGDIQGFIGANIEIRF